MIEIRLFVTLNSGLARRVAGRQRREQIVVPAIAVAQQYAGRCLTMEAGVNSSSTIQTSDAYITPQKMDYLSVVQSWMMEERANLQHWNREGHVFITPK
ncbi:hypothetical protein [Halobacterium sp. KA-6]|uniref:hypothetical protein n=1 Tax=Halobacterium sp. KA-6 TaxID=2896368 RepID=UPI001E28D2BA|nr:hypothetical protein [Halobacterium sp. KA-6]MCD2204012.1 hypothetical protein [Halobacterium sp. KA-6]